MNEFEKIEYEQLGETFRASILTLVNVLSLLIIANITVLGYAINNRKAGIFLVGSLICLAAFIILQIYRRYMIPFAYRAIHLETKYIGRPDATISSFLTSFFGPALVDRLRQIAKIENGDDRIVQLNQIKPSAPGQRWSTWLIAVCLVVQILCIPVLVHLWQWEFL